jgi:hypothetical protein
MVKETPAPVTVRKSFTPPISFRSFSLRSDAPLPSHCAVCSSCCLFFLSLYYFLITSISSSIFFSYFCRDFKFLPELAHLLFSHPTEILPLFDEAAHRSQASFIFLLPFSEEKSTTIFFFWKACYLLELTFLPALPESRNF